MPPSQVEVKNEMEGFGNSWSAAIVKKKTGSKFTVEYTGFLDEKEKPLSEAGIDRKRLRLAPDGPDKGTHNTRFQPVASHAVAAPM